MTNKTQDTTQLERVVKQILIEKEEQEKKLLTKTLTTYAQTVAEEAVRAERERIKKEITEQTLLNDGDNTFVKLGEALWVCDSKEERAAFMKALAPLPDKE